MQKNTGHRSVFISDTHLGSKHCRAEELLDFLKQIKTEKLYLVGDIVDGWRLQKKWYWPNAHNRIIRQLIKLSKDIEVIYITGNHDEFLRTVDPINIGNIKVVNNTIHVGVDGRRYLAVHGDMFDYLMKTKFGRWVMRIGDFAYDRLIGLNIFINRLRAFFGKPYWSVSKYLKYKAKAASNFVGEFEIEMINYCKKRKFDGIICGHIHTPAIREVDGVTYMNDGDWCENCSALIETQEGKFEIVYWTSQNLQGRAVKAQKS